jgi:hypothetical protein
MQAIVALIRSAAGRSAGTPGTAAGGSLVARATVTGAGRTLERTVLFYAQWLASHERPHVKQIERAVIG